MIRISFALLVGSVVLMCCQDSSKPPTLPTTYRGTLHGGLMAIGGESTGWMLVEDDQRGGIELDVSRLRDTATRLDGQRVIVSGRMTQRHYPERGTVKVMEVDSIVPEAK